MEYVTDSQGQIMVRDEKGNTKYFHKNMIDNLMLMRRYGFTPVPKPQISEPAPKAVVAQVVNAETIIKRIIEEVKESTNVAEVTEAKRRGRPAKIK